MKNQSLWEISLDEVTATPKFLLEEQAKYLQEITKNKLEGRVIFDKIIDFSELYDNLIENATTEDRKVKFKVIFKIVVPTLNNFNFTLLEVKHDLVDVYPCEIFVPLTKEKFQRVTDEEFQDKLSKIFQNSKVRKTIQNLLSMVE